MYVDVIIIGLILLLVSISYKRFQFFVFAFATIDLILKVLTFLRKNISLGEFSRFLNNYIPSGFEAMIDKYTSGTVNMILGYVYIALIILFIFYCIKVLVKKKRI